MQAHFLRSLIVCSALVAFGATAQTYAADAATTVTCKDGTSSKGGKGACSHHGGVQKGAATAAASSEAASAAAPAPTTAAPSHSKSSSSASTAGSSAGAAGTPRAKCKDGSTSYSRQHRGACSHHGGVAEWLDK